MARRRTIVCGCVLLLAGLLLAACGTSDPTAEAGFGFGPSTATPAVVFEIGSPTDVPSSARSATPEGTPVPLSLMAYLQSFSRIATRQKDLARADLTLMVSGADDAALAAQLQTELPERQQLFEDLKKLTPPDELKTLQANAVTVNQQELDSQQKLIQGVQRGDQSLIDDATQTLLNGQMVQSYCSAGSLQEMVQNQLGEPAGTPSAADLASIPPEIRAYNDALLPLVNNMVSQYRSLCPLLPNAMSDKPAYTAQLKQILPALSKDIDGLAQVTPPDRFSEYHQDLVAGYRKLVEAQQLEVQGSEQNDAAVIKQARVPQAEGELKLLDAQDALQSALMNEMTGP